MELEVVHIVLCSIVLEFIWLFTKSSKVFYESRLRIPLFTQHVNSKYFDFSSCNYER